ncbi:hypothetical protein B0A55_09814 [Friedmanniomyces simplex]|uniref:Uncharacterized protein n=1 Tax=Friedmanniomyces simplex TaxID=329884 RepID=A0A4U0WLQ1_9PEZI|nr:hypothetical protein B0A55_09814 [Friedmanniomyces simplex]
MTGQERMIIRNAWAEEMRAELQDKLQTAITAYNTLKKQLDAIRTVLKLRVLRQANIIGITTSGLARHLDLIRRTGAKVIEVEGQLFWARFAAMEYGAFDAAREGVPPEAIAHTDAMNAEALERLTLAQEICDRFAGKEASPTQGLADEIADVRRMLNEGVSTSEIKMVVAAMAGEFRGTGHCSLPACDAVIGGQNYQATQGVQLARDIDTQFGGLRL